MSKSKTLGAMIVGVLSSVLAFLGLLGCCGLPIIAGFLALLGIGASQLSFLEAYRWWFIGLAAISLLFGFYQVYFKKSNCCCVEDNRGCCSEEPKKPASSLFQKTTLWIGAVAIVVLLVMGLTGNKGAVTSSGDGCCPVEQEQPATDCCPR